MYEIPTTYNMIKKVASHCPLVGAVVSNLASYLYLWSKLTGYTSKLEKSISSLVRQQQFRLYFYKL